MARRNPPARRAAKTAAGRPMWLYGRHAVAAALDNPHRQCLRLLVAAERNAADPLASHPLAKSVTRAEIQAQLPAGAVHQGIALLAEPLPAAGLESLIDTAGAENRPVVVVLDQVSDPQNVGAVLRCCAAFGVAGVVVQERHAPPVTGSLAKAASGAVEHVPLVRETNLARALDRLQAAGYWRLGLDAVAERGIDAPRPAGPIALVLGAEGTGLRRLTQEHCDEIAAIPISTAVASLNVANATAIALYALRSGG